MQYTVTWKPTAENQLAEIWLNAIDREAVRIAANAIDAALARDPMAFGESRRGATRVGFEGPLCVFFDVILEQRAVLVRRLKLARPV